MGEEAQGKDGAMGLGCRTVAPGIYVCGVRGDSHGGTAESTPAVAELAVMCVLDPPMSRSTVCVGPLPIPVQVNWHKGTALNHLLDVLGLRSQVRSVRSVRRSVGRGEGLPPDQSCTFESSVQIDSHISHIPPDLICQMNGIAMGIFVVS